MIGDGIPRQSRGYVCPAPQCAPDEGPPLFQFFIKNFADALGRHIARKSIVDAGGEQSFQFIPCQIGIGIAGKQPFQGILLDAFTLQCRQRFQALVLLVSYVDG